MNKFYGKIELLGKEYSYVVIGYEMIIIDSKEDILKTHKIAQITNRWLKTKINEGKRLIVKLSYKHAGENALIMNIIAFFSIFDMSKFFIEFKQYEIPKRKDEIHKITYVSDVLDYFFRPKGYKDFVSNLIESFHDDVKLKKGNFKHYSFNYNNKNFVMYFGILNEYKRDNRFVFDIHSLLIIECDENIELDEVYKISVYVKTFLAFVSNKRKVYFDEIKINRPYGGNEYKPGYFYLNQGKKENINYCHTLEYNDVEDNIQKIMNKIIENDVLFILLFQYDTNYIKTIDIINICAAFECQFKATYSEFKCQYRKIYPEFKCRFFKTCARLNKNKVSLRQKIEYALADFEKFYQQTSTQHVKIEYDFKEDYREMPSRIVYARNMLAHGDKKTDNKNFQINDDVLTDTILLRAIIYFMIFKSIDMNPTNIMKCIRKFTRFHF